MNETRRRAPAAIAAALAATALLAGGDAAATITVTNVTITVPDGGTQAQRPSTSEYWISYQDCIDDTQFQFTVTSSTGDPVEVGASVSYNCTDPTTVASGTLPIDTCNYHYPNTVPSGGMLTIGAKDLVSGTLGIAVTGPDACLASTAPTGSGIVWPQPITLYFYVPVSGAAASDSVEWPTSPLTMDISLVGPAAPSPVGLGVGDQELIVSLPTTPTDANTLGYYIFCAPFDATGDGGTGGSSTTTTSTTTTSTTTTSTTTTSTTTTSDAGTGDAGTGGTTTTGDAGTGGTGGSAAMGTSDCTPATVTIPGLDPTVPPNLNSMWLSASQVPVTTTSYSLQNCGGVPLVDGTPYKVGIAAYDQVYNLGLMAPLQCGTPVPIDSFFPSYCGAEGGSMGPGCVGGCGSCNVGSGDDPLWPALGVLALTGAVVLVRRDRRRYKGQG